MNKKIFLASSSPRRKELLTLAGVEFEIKIPDVDEAQFPHESPVQMVKRLAFEKASTVWRNELGPGESRIVLAADTTVVSAKGKVLGKPTTKAEAIEMILLLQGKVHKVHTGYALLEVVKGELARKRIRSVETRVYIRPLSRIEARMYVDRGESLDKAGAYAAQGHGMTIIKKIEGSYTNVVGLPMSEVIEDLQKFGWKP